MPRRLLAAVAAILLVVGQAGSALAAASAGSGPGGAAASAPIGKGLVEALDARTTDRFVVEFTAKADLRGASKVKGHTARGEIGPRHPDRPRSKKSQAAAIGARQEGRRQGRRATGSTTR